MGSLTHLVLETLYGLTAKLHFGAYYFSEVLSSLMIVASGSGDQFQISRIVQLLTIVAKVYPFTAPYGVLNAKPPHCPLNHSPNGVLPWEVHCRVHSWWLQDCPQTLVTKKSLLRSKMATCRMSQNWQRASSCVASLLHDKTYSQKFTIVWWNNVTLGGNLGATIDNTGFHIASHYLSFFLHLEMPSNVFLIMTIFAWARQLYQYRITNHTPLISN